MIVEMLDELATKKKKPKTVWVSDGQWKEFKNYMQAISSGIPDFHFNFGFQRRYFYKGIEVRNGP